MQKQSSELIITRKRTTRILFGILILLLLAIALVQEDKLGGLIKTILVYIFGDLVVIPLFVLFVTAVCLFLKETKGISSLKSIFICLVFAYVFLLIPLSQNEFLLKYIFKEYTQIFEIENARNLFEIIKTPSDLKGGIIGYLLFTFFNTIVNTTIAITIGWAGFGVSLIVLVFIAVKMIQDKLPQEKKEKVRKTRKEKPNKIQEQEPAEPLKKFSFGEYEFAKEEENKDPIIEDVEMTEIHDDINIEQSVVTKRMDDFDVFNDDLLSGKPLNPLIDDIEGGDEFDIFKDPLFEGNEKEEEIDIIDEVRDVSDSIYEEHPAASNIYQNRETIQTEPAPYEEKIEEQVEETYEEPTYETYEEPIEDKYEEAEYEDYEEEVEEVVQQTIVNKPQEVKKPTVNKNYRLPPLNLLDNPQFQDNSDNTAEATVKAVRLNAKLASLNIKGKVKDFIVAPSFTRFQIEVDNSVKINIFGTVKNDLMMALSAQTITILTPIPGTSYVGIDIPNVKRTTVTFKECLTQLPFDKQNEKLLMVSGKDILDNVVYFKLNDTPHLLVAGATGGGKSQGLNSYIMSILMRCKPSEVKLVLVDPKQVEFSPYNGIPHLLCPVITDPKEASVALKKLVEEIHKRNALFKEHDKKNIDSYNKYMRETGGEEIPYIVVIIDELANLMLVARTEVEDSINVITSLARSAGIHLVVATQRPSVDVITGVIKANIASRIAFAVTSYQDSRVILDDGGADQLLGRGDMLMKIAGRYTTDRVQGCYVSEEEIARVADYVRGQQEVIYNDDFLDLKEEEEEEEFEEIDATNFTKDEDLYNQILKFLLYNETVSVSSLRRHFSLGQPKAGRFIDMLTDDGYISEPDGNKPRTVFKDLIRSALKGEGED